MQVLVIGASRGIGFEFVRQYRADGHRVTATVRQAADVAKLEALDAQAFVLDVTDAASVSGLAWRVDGTAFDTVIVNAGVYGPRHSGLEPPTQDEFDTVMRTNVLGPMRLAAQVGEVLAPNAKLAVLSSSMGSIGLRTNPSGWLYRASKASLNSVWKDVSLAYAGRAVCVAFHPGWVRTDMGGPGAELEVDQSVADMRRTLAGLGPHDNGRFLNHDGQPLAW
jgi:NAD(P)-dependent dehydrogenase (short-subunit alcohol dehydrogenase family)